MNQLLQRQIRKFCRDTPIPENLSPLFHAVSDAYDGSYEDRTLMERSLDLSSQELIMANQKLRQETETLKIILNDLRDATAALRPSGYQISEWLTSKDEATYLASSLTRLINERKLTEEKLKSRTQELETSKSHIEQEKAKIEAVLRSIGDGVFAVNLEGKIILMNNVVCDLSGYTIEEAHGQHYRQIFHFMVEKDEQTPYPPFIEEVMEKGVIKGLANHTILVKKDGSRIPISDSAAPIKDEHNAILGCIVVLRDVSHERELEKAKDNFISIAAHQLRTPLAIMRWHIELILRHPTLIPEVKTGIEKIHQSNLRMVALVGDLLNVSKIDQGLIQDQPEFINVEALVKNIVTDMAGLLKQKSVTVDLKTKQPLINIFLDKTRFTEVIQNLLSNGAKYSHPNGKITIVLELIENDMQISVIDEGIGIPAKDQQMVFSKFFRAANAIASDAEGSGLGLFVVKFYVERWGGTVWFTSPAANGLGTAFYVRLPCHNH